MACLEMCPLFFLPPFFKVKYFHQFSQVFISLAVGKMGHDHIYSTSEYFLGKALY
jgi:hypothetical protein